MQSAEMICISSRSTTGDSTGVCHEDGAEQEFKFCDVRELAKFGKGKMIYV